MSLNNYTGRLRMIIKDDSKKKSALKISRELTKSILSEKKFPFHYASKFLYRSDSGDYANYLTLEEEVQVRFSKNLHSIGYHTLLKNKLSSALYFEECGLPIPKMPLYNVEQVFFTKEKTIEIHTLDDLYSLLSGVFEDENHESLFVKEFAESGGAGCYLIKKEGLRDQLEKIGPRLLKRSFIYQETIKQHDSLNAINSSCLNTIRFETYIDKEKKSHIVSSYIRFGVGDNVVDNAGAGGFFVSINQETGRLQGKGYQKLAANSGAKTFTHHPSTQFELENAEIPLYKEACDLVLKAMEFVPERYIGWDIAISSDGPIIVEGNAAPHIMVADIAYGGYKKHPLYSEILDEAYKTGIHRDKIMYFKNID
ncbi:sugar-transfer associated ATP-grasp domain-containing protein [Flavimarina sp. Hel_I_48]|uniref:sugar-transfer associated ATP-grasp domain-containing protein n=1 Tax=Flavimarina sp. Hel_I_48 TaxID=1392488 RepID=UPI00068DF316|nr:sugar-transfer associated ATP-grasp domain-containing protein [Flavimarina sp. Hel_I_48]